jgi:hypothetical protein
MRGRAGQVWRRVLGGSRPPSWQAGFAVRREWARGGHELIDWRATPQEALRRLYLDCGYWRRSPMRPVAWCVVPVSRRDVDLHRRRRNCTSPDCPTAADAGALTVGATR